MTYPRLTVIVVVVRAGSLAWFPPIKRGRKTTMMTTTENGSRRTAEDRQRAQFDALVKRSRRQIYSKAYRMLQDASEAEDVTQQALLSAWRSFPQFDGKSW